MPHDPRDTIVPPKLDEVIDIYLSRPVSSVLVSWLKKTPITANQVTLFKSLLAIIAAGLLMQTEPLPLVLSASVLVLVVILDCIDGELAKARRSQSLVGRSLWDG